MGGDQHRGAELVDPLEHPYQQHRDLVVDIACRFVGDQQIGPAHDRAGDRDPLLLAARQGRGAEIELAVESHPAQQLGDVLADFALRRAGDAQRQGDVVAHRQVLDEAEILKDDPHPASQGRMGGAVGRGDVGVEQADDAARRRFGQIDDLQQGCLAGAADPGQKIEAAGVEPQGNIAQDFGIGTVMLADLLQSDHATLRDVPPILARHAFRRAGATLTWQRDVVQPADTEADCRIRSNCENGAGPSARRPGPAPDPISRSRPSTARRTGSSAGRRTWPSAPA